MERFEVEKKMEEEVNAREGTSHRFFFREILEISNFGKIFGGTDFFFFLTKDKTLIIHILNYYYLEKEEEMNVCMIW
ncbi:unnamed protein product, partial [Vitis vinifera]